MHIQFNTDNHIQGREALADRLETLVRDALGRHADRLTRLEAHVQDVNASKTGGGDIRCLLEARPAGRDPIAVTAQGAQVEETVKSAAGKLARALDRIFERDADHKGADTIRKD